MCEGLGLGLCNADSMLGNQAKYDNSNVPPRESTADLYDATWKVSLQKLYERLLATYPECKNEAYLKRLDELRTILGVEPV